MANSTLISVILNILEVKGGFSDVLEWQSSIIEDFTTYVVSSLFVNVPLSLQLYFLFSNCTSLPYKQFSSNCLGHCESTMLILVNRKKFKL